MKGDKRSLKGLLGTTNMESLGLPSAECLSPLSLPLRKKSNAPILVDGRGAGGEGGALRYLSLFLLESKSKLWGTKF
jgi:hypothetical protein